MENILLSVRERRRKWNIAVCCLCQTVDLYLLHLSFCGVFLCQLLKPDEESTSTQRYIDSRTVQPRTKGSWISVDVTETIKDWLSDPGQPQHQRPLWSIQPCLCGSFSCVFFSFLPIQRIISAWSWASTVPAAPSSHPPTTSFPTRARSWRPCLQVCRGSFLFSPYIMLSPVSALIL